MRVLLTQSTPLMRQVRQAQAMTLSPDQDLLTDLLGDHPQTRQDNQEGEDLRVSRHLEDRPVLHLRDLVGIREDLLVDRHHRHRHLLLRLLRTLHRVLQGSLPSLSYQHRRTRRSPMSKRQRTSPRQRSGTVSVDRPSSILKRTDETSTMTRRSFDSC
jgi:hypothetical protein